MKQTWPTTTLPKELRDDIIISGGDIIKRIMESDEPWMWEETEKERDMETCNSCGAYGGPIDGSGPCNKSVRYHIEDDGRTMVGEWRTVVHNDSCPEWVSIEPEKERDMGNKCVPGIVIGSDPAHAIPHRWRHDCALDPQCVPFEALCVNCGAVFDGTCHRGSPDQFGAWPPISLSGWCCDWLPSNVWYQTGDGDGD